MQASRLVSLIGFVALALLLSRCGPKTPAPGTFGSVYQVTLKTACIECHTPSTAATLNNGVVLDLTSQTTAYNTFFGFVVGRVAKGSCGAVRLVVAGSTSTSYLPAALFSDFRTGVNMTGTPACQPHTIDHNLNLSSAEKQSLLDWITSGAKND